MTKPGIGRPRAVGRQTSGKLGGFCHTNAFTLVELLVVISIILLVAVVALPAVGSLSKSSSRRTAVSLTMTALDQARGLSLSQSSIHYLVLADADAAWPEAYRCRAFAIFEETYDPKAQTYQHTLVGKWTQLPEGVAFKADADTLFAAPKEKFYCHPAGRILELPCIKFNSTGGVEQTDTAKITAKMARLRLYEGYLDASGVPVVTNQAGAAGEEIVRVSLQTGRAKREDPNGNG